MSQNKTTAITVAAFALLGMTALGLRHFRLTSADPSHEERLFTLVYDVELVTEHPGSTVRVAVPTDMPQNRVLRSSLSHSDLPVRVFRTNKPEREQLVAYIGRPGTYRLVSEFDIVVDTAASPSPVSTTRALTPGERAYYLRPPALPGEDGAATSHLAVVSPPGDTLEAELLSEIVDRCAADSTSRQLSCALRPANGQDPPTGADAARLLLSVCRRNNFPARLVTGFELEESPDAVPRVWVEINIDGQWLPCDPAKGRAGELPANWVSVRRDGTEILRESDDSVRAKATYSIVAHPPMSDGLESEARGGWGDVLDLTILPASTQKALSLLLILPFGALITALARNIVGISTLGTFTPALLSLSFIYVDWRIGLIVLGTVLTVGLLCRFFLDRLMLLMVPRISVVLTLVVLSLVLAVSTLEHLAMVSTTQAVILPVVIVTMMVERVYIAREEDGLPSTLKLMAGTAAVAVLCFLILRWQALEMMLVSFPEIHFFTVSALILIGRYSGYRLTELWRFAGIVEPSDPGGAP